MLPAVDGKPVQKRGPFVLRPLLMRLTMRSELLVEVWPRIILDVVTIEQPENRMRNLTLNLENFTCRTNIRCSEDLKKDANNVQHFTCKTNIGCDRVLM